MKKPKTSHNRQAFKQRHAQEPSGNAGETTRILIVDNDKRFVAKLADLLASRGYEVRAAGSGTGALRCLASFPADLALLNLELRRVNGIRLLSKFRKLRPHMLCVMTTARPATKTAIEALREGACDYLRKPIGERDLFAALERAFGSVQQCKEKQRSDHNMEACHQELRELNSRLKTILESACALTSCLQVRDLGTRLLQELAANVGAHGGSFYVVRERGLELAYALDAQHAPASIALPLPPNSVFGRVLRTGQPVLVADIEQASEFSRGGWHGYRNRSVLAFPLAVPSRGVLGVLSLHDKALPPFTAQDMDLGSILCSLASGAFRSLQMSEESTHLAVAIEQVAEAIMVTDLDGNIEYCNPAFERITGYSRSDVLGKNPRLLKSGKHDAEFYRRLWNTISSGNVWSGRFTNRKKDGTLFEEEANISAIRDSSGPIRGYVAVKRDVSERLELEAQLRQAAKMEAVGRLAGGIAHDFNNLLTVINGFGDLLLDSIEEGDPIRESIMEICKAGERASSLTQQLLAFSRRQVIRPVVLDLNATIKDVEKMLRRLIGEDVELRAELESALGRVRCDTGQMQQVLMNLAANARDAMPNGGKLVIRTANEEVREMHAERRMTPGPYVTLTVTDNGAGMDEQTQSHLFDPFFTTKELGRGTGLGLATVYGIVKQSGGWIWVDSKLQEGTTFKIYLPRVEAPVTVTELPSLTPALRGNETVLVVEDQEEVRRLATAVLRRCGYKIVEAANGGEALLICERHTGTIHIMLTDVVMPGITGFDLAERLKPLRPEMRVLFMSGYTYDIISDRGVVESRSTFLQKPFTPQLLAAKVREVLGPRNSRGTILVVDEEAAIRSLLRQVLVTADYEVLEAGTLSQARSLLRERHLDIVITDFSMSQKGGLEMVSELAENDPKLRIIVTFSAFEGDFEQSARAMGAHGVLTKPISPPVLLETVQRILTKV